MKAITYNKYRRRLVHRCALAFVLACLAAMAGCRKEDSRIEQSLADKVVVNFFVTDMNEMISKVITKSAIEKDITIRVIAYRTDAEPSADSYVEEQCYVYDGVRFEPCTVDENGACTGAAKPMELMPGTYNFYAVFPALPLKDDKITLKNALMREVDYAVSRTSDVQVSSRNANDLTLNALKRQVCRVAIQVQRSIDVSPVFHDFSQLTFNPISASSVSDVRIDTPVETTTTGIWTLGPDDFKRDNDNRRLSNYHFLLPVDSRAIQAEIIYPERTFRAVIKNAHFQSGHDYLININVDGQELVLSVVDLGANDWSEVVNGSATTSPGWSDVKNGRVARRNIYTYENYESYPNFIGYQHPKWTITPKHAEANKSTNVSQYNIIGYAFEVAKYKSNGVLWSMAEEYCKTYFQTMNDKGKWRLPTAREVDLIVANAANLQNASIDVASEVLWTATEDANDNNRAFTGANSASRAKNNMLGIRCVKDCLETDMVWPRYDRTTSTHIFADEEGTMENPPVFYTDSDPKGPARPRQYWKSARKLRWRSHTLGHATRINDCVNTCKNANERTPSFRELYLMKRYFSTPEGLYGTYWSFDKANNGMQGAVWTTKSAYWETPGGIGNGKLDYEGHHGNHAGVWSAQTWADSGFDTQRTIQYLGTAKETGVSSPEQQTVLHQACKVVWNCHTHAWRGTFEDEKIHCMCVSDE